jgi:hypothetical protein
MSIISLLFAAPKIDPNSIGLDPVKDPNRFIPDLLGVAYAFAGILCVIIIVIAGYMYTTSGGDASHVKRAKDMILGAIVGLVVVMAAFVVTQFVLGRF